MKPGFLRDRIEPGVRVLFVGINPGLRSAATGHHFAGYSNRFWKLLYESRLVPEPLTYVDDDRLPEWGFGITNLIARPSASMNDLAPIEWVAGRQRLFRKIRRHRPAIAALVGVSVYRSLFPERRRAVLTLGLQQETVSGARVFLLPNPSGRNANYSYEEMLKAFRSLRRLLLTHS